jgi:hypothetical protein
MSPQLVITVGKRTLDFYIMKNYNFGTMYRNRSSISCKDVNVYMKFQMIYAIVVLIFKLFDRYKIRLFRSVIGNSAAGQNEAMINGMVYMFCERVVTAEVT